MLVILYLAVLLFAFVQLQLLYSAHKRLQQYTDEEKAQLPYMSYQVQVYGTILVYLAIAGVCVYQLYSMVRSGKVSLSDITSFQPAAGAASPVGGGSCGRRPPIGGGNFRGKYEGLKNDLRSRSGKMGKLPSVPELRKNARDSSVKGLEMLRNRIKSLRR